MWTARTEALAAQMWKDGHSAKEIVPFVGKSRSAVIGKLHRMGLQHGNRAEAVKRNQERELARAARERVRGAVKAERKPAPPKPVKPAGPLKAVIKPIKPGGIALEELTATSCRWPITDNSPHRFCGCKAKDGPYCPEHTAMGRAG